MTQQQPTFVISDASGRNQLGLVKGTISDAQSQAEGTARLLGTTVVLYSMTHIATYGVSAGPAISAAPTKTPPA